MPILPLQTSATSINFFFRTSRRFLSLVLTVTAVFVVNRKNIKTDTHDHYNKICNIERIPFDSKVFFNKDCPYKEDQNEYHIHCKYIMPSFLIIVRMLL